MMLLHQKLRTTMQRAETIPARPANHAKYSALFSEVSAWLLGQEVFETTHQENHGTSGFSSKQGCCMAQCGRTDRLHDFTRVGIVFQCPKKRSTPLNHERPLGTPGYLEPAAWVGNHGLTTGISRMQGLSGDRSDRAPEHQYKTRMAL